MPSDDETRPRQSWRHPLGLCETTRTWRQPLATSEHCESTSTAMPTRLRGAVDHAAGMRCFISAMAHRASRVLGSARVRAPLARPWCGSEHARPHVSDAVHGHHGCGWRRRGRSGCGTAAPTGTRARRAFARCGRRSERRAGTLQRALPARRGLARAATRAGTSGADAARLSVGCIGEARLHRPCGVAPGSRRLAERARFLQQADAHRERLADGPTI